MTVCLQRNMGNDSMVLSPEILGRLGLLQRMNSTELNNVFPGGMNNNPNNNNNNNEWGQLLDLIDDNVNNNVNNNNGGGQQQNENNQCTICLEEFQNGDVRRALDCMHTFHQQCINRWLNIHQSCPICRHRVNR